MDQHAVDNSSSSSPVSSVGSITACLPACPPSRTSLCCRRRRRPCGTRREWQHLSQGSSGPARRKRVWAPGAEKEIPICHAGPAHQVAFKVTVVAASQARVVSKGLVRYGAVRRGMDPITQGVALSRIRGIS